MKLNEQEEKQLYIGLVRDFLNTPFAHRREELGLRADWKAAHDHAMYVINNLNGAYETERMFKESQQ